MTELATNVLDCGDNLDILCRYQGHPYEEGCMHARVSVFQMTPDEVDAGVEYGRGTIQEMTEMEGFRGNLALVDREAGRITSITLWESEEAMRTGEERADAMRSSGAAAVDASVVSVDRYEVGYFIQP